MNSKKIGIIGVNGRFGSHLRRFLCELGYEVYGSDISTIPTNEDIVRMVDVVIFSTTLSRTVEIINSLTRYSRKNQLWMDLTTVKAPTVKAMLMSKSEVVGLHPLFAPPNELCWVDKTVVVCPARLIEWKKWFYDLMFRTRAKLVTIDPAIHDEIMLVEQNLMHIGVLMEIAVIKRLGIDPKHLFELSTPLSRLRFASMGRMLSQDPKLYADIQMSNPGSAEVIDKCISFLMRLKLIVEMGDKRAFVDLFEKSREHLKPGDFFEKAVQFFETSVKK